MKDSETPAIVPLILSKADLNKSITPFDFSPVKAVKSKDFTLSSLAPIQSPITFTRSAMPPINHVTGVIRYSIRAPPTSATTSPTSDIIVVTVLKTSVKVPIKS